MVPKVFKARQELGLSRIEPRHLIDKDNQTSVFRKRIEVLPQKHECLTPGFRGFAKGRIPKSKLVKEIVELVLHGRAFGAGHFENHIILKGLIYEERFSHAPPTHDDRKLGVLFPIAFF